MKRNLLFAALLTLATLAAHALTVADLRCEYLTTPLGLDVSQPRLSWTLQSDTRGERQTAYEILVASSPENLAAGHGDLWDSGKIVSSDTAQIPYAGTPLTSREACYWLVRVWDQNEGGFTASMPAAWTMGLLAPADWQAKWIGAPDTNPPVTLVVRHAEYGPADHSQPAADVTDRVRKRIKAGRLSLAVNKDVLGDPFYHQVKTFRIEYELNGVPGTNELAEGKRLGLPAHAADPAAPVALRKEFTAGNPVKRATLYVSALGLYELTLNGHRVGDELLAPGWTDYRKRVPYQAYDVTALIQPGGNALGAYLASGWYAGHIGNGGFQFWGQNPALLAQLEITHGDGSVERIVSDASWATHSAPIVTSDLMFGEDYDARLEQPGWNLPAFTASGWTAAVEFPDPGITLNSQVSEPVKALQELAPKALSEPKPGHWTYDLGQNMVGVVRLKINAPAGTKITLRHAEMLNPDGTIYTTNLRGQEHFQREIAIDTYICKGGGEEVWQPRFTNHGFRYVELTGLAEKPALEAVTGIVIGSATPPAGEFACSDPRLNQLYSNITWGQRGNYVAVPTDCPQRDERLGWMGDAEVFIRTAAWNADVAGFFTKWLVDVDDAQMPDGRFTDVSPNTGMGSGVPAWADAGVICPWTIYQVYGDRRELAQHLPAMIRWVEWCRAHSTNLLRDHDRGNDYGDWLSIGANTPKDVIGTAYFAYSTHLVAQACEVVGHHEDAEKYTYLFEAIKAAFNQAYVGPDARIKGDTQCVYAMALKFDLLPENLRPLAAQHLEDDINAKGNHLSTGFVGVSYLLPVLTQAGKVKTAYDLLLQDTFPSWLFSVKHGATTIWERWDGWTPEHGFQNAGMNSFNHYSLGSCGEWMFTDIAGIDSDTPGFAHLVIHPRVGGGLTWAKASYNSIRGPVAGDWKLKDGKFTLAITIPPNTTATVWVPAGDASNVLEAGAPAAQSSGVEFQRLEDGCALFKVPAGHYVFTAPAAL